MMCYFLPLVNPPPDTVSIHNKMCMFELRYTLVSMLLCHYQTNAEDK